MRLFSPFFGEAGHKVLRDHGRVFYTFGGVPKDIQPFVVADWLIYDNLDTIRSWLEQNKTGRAILYLHADRTNDATLPRRCYRACSLQQVDRILKAKNV